VQVPINSPDSLLAGFLSGKDPGRLMLITGPSGSGKTRWCQRLVGHASELGIQAEGLLSPAVFEGESKIGIDLLHLGSGARRCLAVRWGEAERGEIIGPWHFDNDTLEWGNDILANIVSSQLLVLDELGPLELERGVGLVNGIGLITARDYQLACAVVRPVLIEAALKLWPWGEIFDVRSGVPSEVSI
jgi:nucleoside-triphosphatase THEP1